MLRIKAINFLFSWNRDPMKGSAHRLPRTPLRQFQFQLQPTGCEQPHGVSAQTAGEQKEISSQLI